MAKYKNSVELDTPDAFETKATIERKKGITVCYIVTAGRVKIYYDERKVTLKQVIDFVKGKQRRSKKENKKTNNNLINKK